MTPDAIAYARERNLRLQRQGLGKVQAFSKTLGCYSKDALACSILSSSSLPLSYKWLIQFLTPTFGIVSRISEFEACSDP